MGKNFKFTVFAFLENVVNLGIFTHAHVPHSELQAESFENLFPLTEETVEEHYDLLYQNSIRKYEDVLEIRFFLFCVICNFSKFDAFTVL